MDFDKKVKQVLQSLGLTDIQSRFYLIVLKTGGMPISKVAKNLGINRTNSYNIVDKLKELDLIWEENAVRGKLVHAKTFEPMLNALENKVSQINSFKSSIGDLIPIFNSYSSAKDSFGPKIKTFEGKSAISNMTEEILTSAKISKEILLFTNQESERTFFSQSKREKFIETRVQNKINIKVLAVDNEKGRELLKEDKKLLRETRLLPKNFIFNSEIYIYDGKISMVDLKSEVIGVIIESDELFRIHWQMFMNLWGSL